MTSTSPSPVKSAMRTLDIIEFVVAHPSGVVAQEIAAALAIPVSSLSYLLGTLCERDYLRRDGRRYLAGGGLDRLRLPASAMSVEDRVAPQVRMLRRACNETTSFFTLTEWELEARVTDSAEQFLRYSIHVGARAPLHCLAAGKAMLATFDDVTLDRYFAQAPRPLYTPRTIAEEGALRAEIDAVRATGFGVTDEEFTLGIVGIGRAVRLDGVVVGALAVALPKLRHDAAVEAQIKDRLVQACAALETA